LLVQPKILMQAALAHLDPALSFSLTCFVSFFLLSLSLFRFILMDLGGGLSPLKSVIKILYKVTY